MLGYYLLRPDTRPQRRRKDTTGFAGKYADAVGFALRHRWLSLAATAIAIGIGFASTSKIKSELFPRATSPTCPTSTSGCRPMRRVGDPTHVQRRRSDRPERRGQASPRAGARAATRWTIRFVCAATALVADSGASVGSQTST